MTLEGEGEGKEERKGEGEGKGKGEGGEGKGEGEGTKMGWLRMLSPTTMGKLSYSITLGTKAGWHSSGYGNKDGLAENAFFKSNKETACLKNFGDKGGLAQQWLWEQREAG